MARLRSNTQISLSVLSIRERRPGPGHPSPRWSQPALSLRQKVTVGGRREPRPTTTWVVPPAPSGPISKQYHKLCNSVKYIVYARDHLPKWSRPSSIAWQTDKSVGPLMEH